MHPSALQGSVTAPPSKSVMQRACALALLRRGRTVLHRPGRSEDDISVMQLLRQAGCTLVEDGTADELTIDSTASQTDPVFSVSFGESGLAARMFTPLLALAPQDIRLTGSGSLLHRPFHFFETVLPALGVQVQTNNGLLPMSIRGPLRPADITIDGSLSSQFLTGLILAYTAAGARDVAIHVTGLHSRPYIDLTLKVAEDMGFPVPENDRYETFRFNGGALPSGGGSVLQYTVEGDWSNAAFLMAAGAIAGPVTVTGLDAFSVQGDKAVLAPLQEAAVPMSIAADSIRTGPGALKPFHFNATHCPDLFPPLAALAAYCRGTSVIEGVSRLRHKESDRSETLREELGKLGIVIMIQGDLMLIEGGGPVRGATVDARGDHRIAMACAVAALGADGPVTLTGAEAVAKSYPRFFGDLQALGCQLLIH